ncbi:TPA: DeoR/GlpR family DNA-binding transcription regulator [Streptococcus suis]
MLMEERHRKILDILAREKHVLVTNLASELKTSQATIRNDLNNMANQKLLIRTHGGASVIDHNTILKDRTFNLRTQINQSQKKAIAELAFQQIRSGDAILIDGSSTCYELAKLLVQSNLKLTVLTNGFATADLLKDSPNITTILIGGVVKQTSNAIESTLGADILKKINIRKLFISAHSFSVESGLSDFNLYEVELKKLMLANTTEHFALVDSSKLEKTSSISFANWSQITYLITDNDINPAFLQKYQSLGLRILIGK